MFRSFKEQLFFVLSLVLFFSYTNTHACLFYTLRNLINLITSEQKRLLAPSDQLTSKEAELLTPFVTPDHRHPYETHLPARLLERFPNKYRLAALRARSSNGDTLWHFAAQHLELRLMFHLREKVPALDAWIKNYKGETPQDLLNKKQREIVRSLNLVRDKRQMMLTFGKQKILTQCEKILNQVKK